VFLCWLLALSTLLRLCVVRLLILNALGRVDLSLIVPLPPQLCPLLLLPGRGLEAGDRVRQAPCWRGSWCSCRW
jgi:hypothetical protein